MTRLIEAEMVQGGLWGTFFPSSLTPFAYNETMAKDWFPLSQEEATKRGYRWREDTEIPDVKKIIKGKDLPQRIVDIPDDVLSWAIRCIDTDRPFRIVKKELEFYRSMQLQLPRRHPEERHRLRTLRRHGRRLWSRSCAKCEKGIETTYAPERPEHVYCEECYLKEVY